MLLRARHRLLLRVSQEHNLRLKRPLSILFTGHFLLKHSSVLVANLLINFFVAIFTRVAFFVIFLRFYFKIFDVVNKDGTNGREFVEEGQKDVYPDIDRLLRRRVPPRHNVVEESPREAKLKAEHHHGQITHLFPHHFPNDLVKQADQVDLSYGEHQGCEDEKGGCPRDNLI